MKKEIRLFFVLVALLMLNMKGQAAEWQWSVEIPSMVSDETGGHPTAFLWIPEDCQRVKAVVVGQHNMCEETLFENVLFRQRMKEAGIALVWITPILNQPWDVATGCNDALLRALDDLAEVSGYGELGRVPIVPWPRIPGTLRLGTLNAHWLSSLITVTHRVLIYAAMDALTWNGGGCGTLTASPD